MASRDELLDQVNMLKKKFIKYKDYADATINEIFSKDKIAGSIVLHCNELSSGILYNNGSNHFDFKSMPLQAQFSKMFGSISFDFDNDGKKDLLCAGNYYSYRVQLGRADASYGVLLKQEADASYSVIDPASSGLYMDGDIRAVVLVKNKAGENIVIAAKNNDAVQVLKQKSK
jgi:hypothetical protein